MKNRFNVSLVRLFRIIALVAVIGFSMAGCDNGTTPGGGGSQNSNDITAAQLVADIKIGWNLGNSLDANLKTANPTVTQMETAWGNPVTTKAMITAIKNAGFNAIRIPVSWTKAAGGAPNYTIRADWMARVKEIVNYAVDNDMYIILNTHHDEEVLTFMNSNAAAGKAAFQKLWEQIADAFKDYNEKLIFEGLNEPRTPGSSNEWSGGTPEERANLNSYYPIFVNTVRNSGGNNNKRILIINAYAASAEASAMDALTLPTDSAANKLIVSFHSYNPYDFALNTDPAKNSWNKNNSGDTSPITGSIDRYYTKFVSKGTPVLIGEFGAMNKNNEAVRAQWAEYYISYARSKGIKCFWWDNGVTTGDGELFGLLNRQNNTFTYPALLNGMMSGTGGGGGGNQTPVASDYTIGNLNQLAGHVVEVNITAKSGKSTGEVSIKYAGNTAIPQTAGTYSVTFDVASATGWNAATNLSAGSLVIKNWIDPATQTTQLTGGTVLQSYSGGWGVALSGSPYFYDTWDYSEGVGSTNKFTWYGANQGGGGAFKAEWTAYFLARLGYHWGNGGSYTKYNNIYIDYNFKRTNNASAGGGFIGVYGWFKSPSASNNNDKLIEYYIVEDWFKDKQIDLSDVTTFGDSKELGSFTVDGATYKIYKNTQVNQPSIDGDKDFTQIFSVRQGRRTYGTISVTEHFNEWSKYLKLDDIGEVKFKVEAFGGNGNLDLTYLYLSQEENRRDWMYTPGGETVVGSYSAYANNPHISLSSSVNYQVVNLPDEGKTNVLKVVNPGEWAVALYDLTSFKGQNKTITFSTQVKRVGAAGTLNWQIIKSSYTGISRAAESRSSVSEVGKLRAVSNIAR